MVPNQASSKDKYVFQNLFFEPKEAQKDAKKHDTEGGAYNQVPPDPPENNMPFSSLQMIKQTKFPINPIY